MIGVPSSRPSAAVELDTGETVVVVLDDVRWVPGVPPGHVGTLAVTSTHLRFRESSRISDHVLHGFPDLGALVRGGQGARLTVPLGQIASVSTERTLGVFSILCIRLRDGRTHRFHVGLRALAPLVKALPRA